VGWQVGLLDNHVFAISFQIASSRKTSGKQSTGPTGQGGVGGGSSSGGVKTIIKSICNKPHGTHGKRNKNAQ